MIRIRVAWGMGGGVSVDLDPDPRSNNGLPGKMEFTLSVVNFSV
jgi:hypothetical protein